MKNRFGIPRRTGFRRHSSLSPKRRFRPKKGQDDSVGRECDILWSSIIRLAANGCCAFRDIECDGRMEAHHLITRSSSFKWDLSNGICVCRFHHQEWHGNPTAWGMLLAVVYPETWEWWQANRYVVRPQWMPDMDVIRNELYAWRDLLQETVL